MQVTQETQPITQVEEALQLPKAEQLQNTIYREEEVLIQILIQQQQPQEERITLTEHVQLQEL
jgi:hypothetical protein